MGDILQASHVLSVIAQIPAQKLSKFLLQIIFMISTDLTCWSKFWNSIYLCDFNFNHHLILNRLKNITSFQSRQSFARVMD